jgi:hypothetical protein
MDFLGGLTRSNNSTGKALGLAAVVATGLAAAYFMLGTSTANSDLLPALTEEEAYDILKKIFDRLRQSSEKLMQHLPSIQQQLQSQGMDVPAATVVKSYIFPHFEMAFKEIQAEILAEADVEEYELEDAVTTYIAMGDTKLAEVSERLRMLHSAMGGESQEDADAAAGGSGGGNGDDGSEDLSLEALTHVLLRLSKHMEAEMDAYCKQFIAENGPPSSAEGLQDFQAGVVAISDRSV